MLHKKIPDADKASVNFHTDHSRGSLAKVLTRIADSGINLSKLQSFPIPEVIGNIVFMQIWNSIPWNNFKRQLKK
jgi:prephenate dehydratase